MTQQWIVVVGDSSISNLIELASSYGDIKSLVIGSHALSAAVSTVVAETVWIEQNPDIPIAAYASIAADFFVDLVADENTITVFCTNTDNGRIIGAAIAAALHSPLVTNITKIIPCEDSFQISRLAYGGLIVEKIAVPLTCTLIVDGGSQLSHPAEECKNSAKTTPVAYMSKKKPLPMRLEKQKETQSHQADLGSARKVIGVGRGFREKNNLKLAEELAECLGAQIACSRPVAEDLCWLPKERYLGVSGRKISPDLYLALGISGQLQHMIGVRGAKRILAINQDPQAEIVNEADITALADLRELLPLLIKELHNLRTHKEDRQ